MRLASAPIKRSSITTTGSGGSASGLREVCSSDFSSDTLAKSARSAASAAAKSSQTGTPLPAIRPSALTTTPRDPDGAPSPAGKRGGRPRGGDAPAPSHPDAGRLGHFAAEGLAPLDPSGGASRPEG